LLPAVNIDGAAWGTLLCYAVLLVGGLAVLSGEMSHPLQAVTVWICPALGGTLCAAVAFWTLKRLQRAVSLQISLPVSIGLGALAYLFFLLIVKPLTQDEISILTKNVKKTQKR
jgi:stage V sporulation protein B